METTKVQWNLGYTLNTGNFQNIRLDCQVSDFVREHESTKEAIQTILRRENYPNPYEALKALTRGHEGITQASMAKFIDGLKVSKKVKDELKAITPSNYTGIIADF